MTTAYPFTLDLCKIIAVLDKNSTVKTPTSDIQQFATQSLVSKTLRKNIFETIVGKGDQHFLLFSQPFLPFTKQISVPQFAFILSVAK